MDHPIDGQELLKRLRESEKLNLLDVRGEMEFHTYNIGGKNIPLPRLRENIDACGYNKTDEIIVICKLGLRSDTATRVLTEMGYRNARNLAGGLIALQKLKK
jgi:rhodanese-related sulfurtransferase